MSFIVLIYHIEAEIPELQTDEGLNTHVKYSMLGTWSMICSLDLDVIGYCLVPDIDTENGSNI